MSFETMRAIAISCQLLRAAPKKADAPEPVELSMSSLNLDGANAELARRDLTAFCKRMEPAFTAPPHIRLLVDLLTQLENPSSGLNRLVREPASEIREDHALLPTLSGLGDWARFKTFCHSRKPFE